jgi:hypothetical protein
MKTLLRLLVGFALSVPLLAEVGHAVKDDIVVQGDWVVVTVLLHEATRSQVVLGKIKYKGVEVIGEPGHVLDLPKARYVWRGSYEQGYYRGWIAVDSQTKLGALTPAELSSQTLGGLYYTRKKG